MTVARLSDVTFAYGDRSVLESVSLTLREGEFLGLLGPNGSGKSTLVKLLVGLLEPDEGAVSLFGDPAASPAAGGRVGYVQQDASGVADGVPLTVRELVRTGQYVGRSGDDESLRTAMDRADVADLADRRIDRLSGGQRQRAFVARALAGGAELLVLDEPAVGVDATARERFYEVLGELTDAGLTVVLVDHDVGAVVEHATRVACLNRRLHFHGPPSELTDAGGLERAYGDERCVLGLTLG